MIFVQFLCDLYMIFVCEVRDTKLCCSAALVILSIICLSFSPDQDLERDYQGKLDKLKQGERTRPLFCRSYLACDLYF